jgi:toxin secretion/phage lysis holin
MKEIWTWIQLMIAAIGGWIGWFLGGADGFLYALIAFVVIDYITGVMCAIVDHRLSSEVGFKGICKKVLIFMMVGIGNIIDVQVLGQAGVCALRSSSSIYPMRVCRCLKMPDISDCPSRRN